ncbi:hypothetical protein ACLOJK_000110 [Asimina triloba]
MFQRDGSQLVHVKCRFYFAAGSHGISLPSHVQQAAAEFSAAIQAANSSRMQQPKAATPLIGYSIQTQRTQQITITSSHHDPTIRNKQQQPTSHLQATSSSISSFHLPTTTQHRQCCHHPHASIKHMGSHLDHTLKKLQWWPTEHSVHHP